MRSRRPIFVGTGSCPGPATHHVVLFDSGMPEPRASAVELARSMALTLPSADITVATSPSDADGGVVARHLRERATRPEVLRHPPPPLYVFGRPDDVPAIVELVGDVGRPWRTGGTGEEVALVGVTDATEDTMTKLAYRLAGLAAGGQAKTARITTGVDPKGGIGHLNRHLVADVIRHVDLTDSARCDFVDWDRLAVSAELGLVDPTAAAGRPDDVRIHGELLSWMGAIGAVHIGAWEAPEVVVVNPGPVADATDMLRVNRLAQLVAQARPERRMCVVPGWDLAAGKAFDPSVLEDSCERWQAHLPGSRLLSRRGLIRLGKSEQVKPSSRLADVIKDQRARQARYQETHRR